MLFCNWCKVRFTKRDTVVKVLLRDCGEVWAELYHEKCCSSVMYPPYIKIEQVTEVDILQYISFSSRRHGFGTCICGKIFARRTANSKYCSCKCAGVARSQRIALLQNNIVSEQE